MNPKEINGYPVELECYRNGKKSITKLTNPIGGIKVYTSIDGMLIIDKVGGKYGISYLSNKHPFSYRSKLLKDWKLKRPALQQLDHNDIARPNWEIVKIDDKEYVQMGEIVSIYDKIEKKKKFVICPTFIYNWCYLYYSKIKGYRTLPKSIKGKKFLEIYIDAVDYSVENAEKYNLFPEDLEKLRNFYYEMKRHAYLKGIYVIKAKIRLY